MNKNVPLILNQYFTKEAAKKTLVISPHADDEILGCFAYIENEIQKGNIVDVIIMGVSQYSTYGGKQIKMQEKIDEIDNCHKSIGIRRSIIYSNMESVLDTIPQSQIVKFFDDILKENYDTVFIPYKSRHIDHIVTYNTALASLRLKEGKKPEKEVYLYEYPFIGNFDIVEGGAVFLPMNEQQLQRKIRTFEIYKSQLKKSPSPLNKSGITTLSRMRGMEIGEEFAEKYYLQTKILSIL